MVRVAVVDHDLCKPHRCAKECVRFCPVNRAKRNRVMGLYAIYLSEEHGGKAIINESLCVGCGICVKKCPFNAIYVVNLPDELEKMVVHRYGINTFKLYGLPLPGRDYVLGIIGKNGTGKTTSVRILAGEIVPNLGRVGEEVTWDDVLKHFRGTEFYNYFKGIVDKKYRVVHKIQNIDIIRRRVKGTVDQVLQRIDERGMLNEVRKYVDLDSAWGKKISHLSGGELQKLAIAAALLRQADIYFFDEPSSYLDVKERLAIARAIRELPPKNAYVVVVEHDLAMLDYTSDKVAIVYGEPGVYGIFSKPYAVGAGINHYLLGYLPAENMVIRKEKIVFRVHAEAPERELETKITYLTWGDLKKRLNGFELSVEGGEVYQGEVIGILGPNAIGKTTFIRMLAGELEPDEGEVPTEAYRISYKPQYISPKNYPWATVEEALNEITKEGIAATDWFKVDVIRRLRLHKLGDREISQLSGGELQKFAIAVALATDADIYLLDEPSAYIDVEDRFTVMRAIKRVATVRKVAMFVVDHDLNVIDYVANRVMVFRGVPGREGHAMAPTDLRTGMNTFLKDVGVTFRRDLKTGRPRVNRPGSYLDRKQKAIGEYYYVPRAEEVTEEE